MKKKLLLSVAGTALFLGTLSAQGFAADEWYENLESSTMKYAHTASPALDRRAIAAGLVSDTNDSRIAQNAWGASSQMMIKPAEGG